MSRPKLLFLAHLLPWPLEGGGQIKSYHVLQQLALAYDIKLLALIRPADDPRNAAPLGPLCSLGVETIPLHRTTASNLRAAVSALVTGRSFLVTRDDTPAFRAAVARELATGDYAALHVDHLQMAAFVPDPLPGVKVILDEHNVEYRLPERLSQTAVNPLHRLYGAGEGRRLRRFEAAALQRADLTLAVSDEDRAALGALVPETRCRIETLPIGVDTDYFAYRARPATAARSLVSIGTMYWPPNVDALRWFCAEVFPRVLTAAPDVTLTIVGAKPTAAVQALAQNPAVTVTGSVPDVRPYAEQARVFIVPLRSGSGMRVKILTALAMGLPTVSTTVGAEGIDVRDGEHLLLADTPSAFADATLRLLRDPALAERLARNGRRQMENRYGWDAIGTRLRALYAEVLAR